jgi:hypothetical protein
MSLKLLITPNNHEVKNTPIADILSRVLSQVAAIENGAATKQQFIDSLDMMSGCFRTNTDSDIQKSLQELEKKDHEKWKYFSWRDTDCDDKRL